MEIKTQYNFTFKIVDSTYNFSIIANSQEEAKKILKEHMEEMITEL